MIIVLCKLGRSFSGEPNLKGYIFCARGSTFNNLRDNSNSHSNLITDVHPKGGGGFQDSGRKWTWGEGGFWGSGCPLFRNFQILLCPKSYTFEIKVELLPFMGQNGKLVYGETNVFKFSSSTERI